MPVAAQSAGRQPLPGTPSDGGVTLIDRDSPASQSGVLRLWRTYSTSGARVILKVYRPESDRLVLVGASALETVPPGRFATFTCMIPVSRNDYIGCYCPDSTCIDRFPNGVVFRADGDVGTVLTSQLLSESGTPALYAATTPSVDIPSTADRNLVLPVAARTPGYNNTMWLTSFELFNPSYTAVTATLFLNLSDRDNTTPAASARIEVPGRATVVFEDLMWEVFQMQQATGAVDVVALSPVLAHARISNNGTGNGSFGQLVPALPSRWASGKDHVAGFNPNGDNVYLFEVREDESWRTNLGVVNISSVPLTVLIRAWDDDEEVGRPLAVNVEPRSHTQISRILNVLSAPGHLHQLLLQVNAAETTSGRFFAYASRVDNRTGDAVFLMGVRESSLP